MPQKRYIGRLGDDDDDDDDGGDDDDDDLESPLSDSTSPMSDGVASAVPGQKPNALGRIGSFVIDRPG